MWWNINVKNSTIYSIFSVEHYVSAELWLKNTETVRIRIDIPRILLMTFFDPNPPPPFLFQVSLFNYCVTSLINVL